MYSFRITTGPVDLAFTDRVGGVSAAPYGELNLARDGEDAESARSENLRLLLDDFAPGDDLADLHQVHGNAVVLADEGDRTSYDGPPEADGIVTATPGVTLMVRAADCVPVLLADPDARVIGAAHAGRLGMALGVVPATVARMRELGAGHVSAWVGPHICGSCYEVPADLQEEVAARVPASRATTSWGTPALDIGAGVRAQLVAAGVEVIDAGRCTRESPDLYSYRRDGAGAGRHAGLIRLGGHR
ncbi:MULTISPECIES: peptidoglycan editing factor PgeF [unclassified Nocardioides]|uniref:peptidoglycan editing factor PgeF n=1 Tax=unclassified Nocardioides TaxID=2615069 RepID=UPI0006FEF239|nr:MULTISPECIES: peptidoglycan editing factor PgeF [unclassified Nocardioides]KRA37365.1 laccase [Nocardioides sp. Root614]KRA91326.1 laccase [Nocardioides sp. Root682]